MERVRWSAERARHIQTRSQRYPGAVDIEPDWTQEAAADLASVVDEPDTKSAHANSVRIIGYSPTVDMVLTIVGLRGRDSVVRGASAWKATGADRRRYEEEGR